MPYLIMARFSRYVVEGGYNNNNNIRFPGSVMANHTLFVHVYILHVYYGMNLNNIMKVWNERCANEEVIRKCEQVRELCEVRNRCVTSILNKEESCTIIELLCTYTMFTYVFF